MYAIVHHHDKLDGRQVNQWPLLFLRVLLPLIHSPAALVLVDQMRHELGMRSKQIRCRHHILEAVLLCYTLDVAHADDQCAGVAMLG